MYVTSTCPPHQIAARIFFPPLVLGEHKKTYFVLNKLFFHFLFFFILTSQMILHHHVISVDYCYCLLCEFLAVLAFESMDDPHIQCLQMACAIWGKKYNLSILQGSGISWMCSILVNEGEIFMFLSLSGNPVAQETPQKWLNSSMNRNLLCIWWGVFLYF